MISTSGFSRRSARATSSPEPSPRFLSTSATSSSPGSSARAIASRAEPASTSVRPSASRKRRSTSRMTGSSSTIRIVAMVCLHSEPDARRQPERRERAGRPAARGEERYLEERDGEALLQPGRDREARRGSRAVLTEERPRRRRDRHDRPARELSLRRRAREHGRERRAVAALRPRLDAPRHLRPPADREGEIGGALRRDGGRGPGEAAGEVEAEAAAPLEQEGGPGRREEGRGRRTRVSGARRDRDVHRPRDRGGDVAHVELSARALGYPDDPAPLRGDDRSGRDRVPEPIGDRHAQHRHADAVRADDRRRVEPEGGRRSGAERQRASARDPERWRGRGDDRLRAAERRAGREPRAELAGAALADVGEVAAARLDRERRRDRIPCAVERAGADGGRLAARLERLAIEGDRDDRGWAGGRLDAEDGARRGRGGEPDREPLLSRGAGRQGPARLVRARLALDDRDGPARGLEQRRVPAAGRAVRSDDVRDDANLLLAVRPDAGAVGDRVQERRLRYAQVDRAEALVRLAHARGDDDGNDGDPVLAGDPRAEGAIPDTERDLAPRRAADPRVALARHRDREPAVLDGARAARHGRDDRDARDVVGKRVVARREAAAREPADRVDPPGARGERDLLDLRRRRDLQVRAGVAAEHEPRRHRGDAQRAPGRGYGLLGARAA